MNVYPSVSEYATDMHALVSFFDTVQLVIICSLLTFLKRNIRDVQHRPYQIVLCFQNVTRCHDHAYIWFHLRASETHDLPFSDFHESQMLNSIACRSLAPISPKPNGKYYARNESIAFTAPIFTNNQLFCGHYRVSSWVCACCESGCTGARASLCTCSLTNPRCNALPSCQLRLLWL